MMAKQNKRRAKGILKTKNEYAGCAGTFGPNLERRWHTREQHGNPRSYCIPSCKWTTRRMGRLRTHLNNDHHSQASSNHTLPSEFLTATVQSLASSNPYSTADVNIGLDFTPTTRRISIDSAYAPQFPLDVSESHTALNSEGASSPREQSPTPDFSAYSRAGTKTGQHRIFRPCRAVRRPKTRTLAGTTSAGAPLIHRGSAMRSMSAFYSSAQGDLAMASAQLRSYTFSFEPIASSFGSLSLDSSIG